MFNTITQEGPPNSGGLFTAYMHCHCYSPSTESSFQLFLLSSATYLSLGQFTTLSYIWPVCCAPSHYTHCYDIACGPQLCFHFLLYALPLPPHIACCPCAWPQRMTCDLASHDWQSGSLASGACRCVFPVSQLLYEPPYACIWTSMAMSASAWMLHDIVLSWTIIPTQACTTMYSHRLVITVLSLTYSYFTKLSHLVA